MNKKSLKSNFIEFKVGRSGEISSGKVKKYLKEINSPDITVDLSSMNVIDAAKVMVLASVYHSGKYPDGKIRCKLSGDCGYDFIHPFITKNLEFV